MFVPFSKTILAFQSLLSQGISLLLGGGNPVEEIIESMFQSLLSQGISLLRSGEGGAAARAKPDRFNPFLVRASVYCFSQGS